MAPPGRPARRSVVPGAANMAVERLHLTPMPDWRTAPPFEFVPGPGRSAATPDGSLWGFFPKSR